MAEIYQTIFRATASKTLPRVGLPSDIQVGDILVFRHDKYLTRIVSGVHRDFVFTHPLRDEVLSQYDPIYKVKFEDFWEIIRPPTDQPEPEPEPGPPKLKKPKKPRPKKPKPVKKGTKKSRGGMDLLDFLTSED